MSLRANQVRMATMTKMDRPGLAQPFMVPAKLKDQLRATPMTDLMFNPTSRANGTQWRIAVQRPGLAQPAITARDEQVTAQEVVAAVNAKETPPSAQAATMEVAIANANNNGGGGVAGFLGGLFRR